MTQPYMVGCCCGGKIWVGGNYLRASLVNCHRNLVRIDDSDGVLFVNPYPTVPNWGMNNQVNAIVNYAGATTVTGAFTEAQPGFGPSPRNVVKFTPSGWQSLAAPVGGLALAVFAGLLYLGSSTQPSSGIAPVQRYDGVAWEAVPNIGGEQDFIFDTVSSLASFGGSLFAGGVFRIQQPGGNVQIRMARWSGAGLWQSAMTGLPANVAVGQFAEWNGSLYVAAGTAGVFRWDGASWTNTAIGFGGLINPRYLAVHSGLLMASSQTSGNIYVYDGVSWNPLGGAVNGGGPIASDGAGLYWAGGTAGGIGTMIRKWTGLSTQDVGLLSGNAGSVQVMANA